MTCGPTSETNPPIPMTGITAGGKTDRAVQNKSGCLRASWAVRNLNQLDGTTGKLIWTDAYGNTEAIGQHAKTERRKGLPHKNAAMYTVAHRPAPPPLVPSPESVKLRGRLTFRNP